MHVSQTPNSNGSESVSVGHITFDDVKRAYERLESAGVRVSTRKVHEELGFKGSRTTVVKHFAVIHQSRVAAQPSTAVPLSPLLLRELASEVDRLVKERTAQLAAELLDLRASLELVVDENESFRGTAAEAESRVAQLQVSVAEQFGVAEELRSQVTSLSEQLKVAASEAEAARQALAVSREQLRASEERVIRLEATDAEVQSELRAARQESVELRGRLEGSVRECIALQAQAQTGHEIESRFEKSTAEVQKLNAQLEEVRGRLAASDAQRAGLADRLKDAQDALSRAEVTSQQLLRRVLGEAPSPVTPGGTALPPPGASSATDTAPIPRTP